MIDHVFRAELAGRIPELLDGCLTLDEYVKRLSSLSTGATTSHFVEHGFQALVEAIIEYRHILVPHEVVQTFDDDLWVHGRGLNLLGQKSTVGSFYVSDESKPLTANKNHLTSFLANSIAHYEVDTTQPHTMYLFSNAISIHEKARIQWIKGQNLEHTLVIKLKKDIEDLINNNIEFWAYFEVNMTIERSNPVVQKHLRLHQTNGVNACINANIGQILLPTGTGKSEIEAAVIANIVSKNRVAVCMLCTPRIVLTYQLINTIFEHFVSRKIEAKYVNLNSGDFNEDTLKNVMVQAGLMPRDIPSTTSPKGLEEAYYNSQKHRIPLIIGSTYHSANRILASSLPVDLYIADEAHNLVMGRIATGHKEDNHRIIKSAKAKFFFTATPAYSGDSDAGSGMNNPNLFGEVIYKESPRSMIMAGEIIPPYIHTVSIDKLSIKQRLGKQDIVVTNDDLCNFENNVEVASLIVADAFREHNQTVKLKSCAPDSIGAKLLVVCKGEPSFKGFFHSKSMELFKKENPKVKFFGVSSATGAYIDGETIYAPGNKEEKDKNHKRSSNFKEKFMLALKKMKNNDEAIIFHIDMIGEGIDVPGITGVMTFRDLGDLKSAQTLGRAMRLCDEDRVNLYSKKIKPLDFVKMVKPFAWVVLPCYSWEQADSMARVKEMAEKMRNDLGYTPFQDVNGGSANGRLEQLRKDEFSLGGIPETMKVIHELDDPAFLMDAEALIQAVNSGDKKTKKVLIDIFAPK